jgi:hypothetical protein
MVLRALLPVDVLSMAACLGQHPVMLGRPVGGCANVTELQHGHGDDGAHERQQQGEPRAQAQAQTQVGKILHVSLPEWRPVPGAPGGGFYEVAVTSW